MNYTVSASALWETCVYTLQTSEPRIHLKMPQRDGPEGQKIDVIIVENSFFYATYSGLDCCGSLVYIKITK